MFTALEYTALDKHESLGYRLPVFLEAMCIESPFPLHTEIHHLAATQILLMYISSLNKLSI